MSPAARATAAFLRRYGDPPAGTWSVPGRANLIGEHTDYNDGLVLPFGLARHTAVAASPVDSPEWTVWSEQAGERVTFDADELSPGKVTGWASYVAGVVWALRDAGYPVGGTRLAIASDVPVGAGLSSSAALECATLAALTGAHRIEVPLADRPALAQRAENDYVGMPCGIMDQFAVVCSRPGHVLYLDCRSLATRHIPFDPAAAGLALLVIDARAPHRLVGGDFAARRAACERAARTLGVPALRDIDPAGLPTALPRLDAESARRVRHVVTEIQRVRDTVALLEAGRVAAIGPLLTASHASLRDDFAVTVPELDTAVEAALAAGAYGARMTGGGFGGCVLALVDADAAGRVFGAVAAAFAARGFTAPALV